MGRYLTVEDWDAAKRGEHRWARSRIRLRERESHAALEAAFARGFEMGARRQRAVSAKHVTEALADHMDSERIGNMGGVVALHAPLAKLPKPRPPKLFKGGY